MNDCFQRLGLPRRFSVDPGELERAYLAHSRAVHPDFHLAGTGGERSASLELSAEINEAYNTLRDPFSRADYLVKLEGGPTAADHKQIAQSFLSEMLEDREEIEQARGREQEIARLDAMFAGKFAEIMKQVESLFTRREQLPAGDAQRASLLTEVRSLLNAGKYVRGLLRDLHAD